MRAISRPIVDRSRPNPAPITAADRPAATPNAISSRSANDKYRPLAGGSTKLMGHIPPPSRNHRVPVLFCTRTRRPAFSATTPWAINRQNALR